MKTLKRTLCLVLVAVMALSLFAVAASAKTLSSYTDASAVSSEYKTAVDFSTQVGVLKGVTDTTYGATGTLTRAQLATMIYRIATGDVADAYVANYANGTRFSDVKAGAWYTGYINYAADNGYLEGVGNGKYDPAGTLTGYQAMAALLRVLGYGKKGEFVGSDWTKGVTQYAAAINAGIVANWAGPISRQVAAQLVFNTMFADEVTYNAVTEAYSVDSNPITTAIEKSTLKERVFKITSPKAGEDLRDNYGRPSKVWKDTDTVRTPLTDVSAVIADTPIYSFYDAKIECDVASVLGTKLAASYNLYTNNGTASGTDTINPLNRVDVIGAQGRLTEIYDDEIVYVDTIVGVVDSVTKRAYDAAGHVWKPSTMTVTVAAGDSTQTVNFVELTTADYAYAANDVIALTYHSGSLSATYTEYDIVGKITPATVTVNSIIKSESGALVGFRATSGTAYAYNCTFKNASKLDTTAIGGTYNVWTDARGNVLKIAAVAPAGTSGLGVVTAVDVVRVATDKYAVAATVLGTDGATTTVNFGKTADAYYAASDVTALESSVATTYLNKLVSWATDGDVDGILAASVKTEGTIASVDCGEPNSLTNARVVNDETVFFVANYTYVNGSAKYVQTGYDIVKGYKNIKDLQITAGTFEDGAQSALAYAWIDNIDVVADTDIDVVLIKYANKQVIPATQAVANYAFLMTKGTFVEISNDSHLYTAIFNGVAGNKLQVTNAAAINYVDSTGLYTYANATVNGWDTVTKVTTSYAKTTYSYSKGVLSVTGDKLAVADNCAVYVVNTTTGATTAIALADVNTYASEYAAYVQYDANGYVSLIYMVEDVLTTP